jgi:hypothetical protein
MLQGAPCPILIAPQLLCQEPRCPSRGQTLGGHTLIIQGHARRGVPAMRGGALGRNHGRARTDDRAGQERHGGRSLSVRQRPMGPAGCPAVETAG